jgi:signal transduction histidine kinase
MPITKSIVELMGGTIEVESEKSVYIYLIFGLVLYS